jgi:hypothetical protein
MAERTGYPSSGRPTTTSRPRRPRTPPSTPRVRSRPSPRRCSRSPTTCAGCRAGPVTGIAEIKLPALQPGLVDHAGQGQPGDVGDDDAGGRPGDRQRHRHHLGWGQRQLRVERDDAGDGPQPARVDRPARPRPPPTWRPSASTGSRPTPSGPRSCSRRTSSWSPPSTRTSATTTGVAKGRQAGVRRGTHAVRDVVLEEGLMSR